ncbi:stAR-related lipid transfer 7, mitochondrial [Pelobates cultripes]|uniref:StAR-related lipid transfer protein 7, mitochondrial n=1 Tax=Pelobates cultripes TaxID=61616 RepID=A0AAD1VVD0_PELCU|nr:stAR-related lipid transfer 7, mitochondrial [Pelobates cultripes]
MWQRARRGLTAGVLGWLRSRLPLLYQYGRPQPWRGECGARALIRGFRYKPRPGRTGRLLAALTGAFLWEDERVREDEILRSAEEMKHMQFITRMFQGQTVAYDEDQGWELVMDKKDFRLWRRPIEGTHLYQYRVFGSYADVTPRQFFNVQLDTEYRKKWDALVIKLEVIERDTMSGSEVIHWVTHFPYPMYSRDYVYVRKFHVDHENNVMVLVSRAVDHPDVPESPDYVRVRNYQSQMVITPHTTFDENGFDYLLTYSDNPQTVFPRYCVNWMVSSGMPDFLDKLHLATLRAKNMEIKVKDYISLRPQDCVYDNYSSFTRCQSNTRNDWGVMGPTNWRECTGKGKHAPTHYLMHTSHHGKEATIVQNAPNKWQSQNMCSMAPAPTSQRQQSSDELFSSSTLCTPLVIQLTMGRSGENMVRDSSGASLMSKCGSRIRQLQIRHELSRNRE